MFLTTLRRPFKALSGALTLGTLLLAQNALAATLETRFGPVQIDGEAQRVVTLYEGALDAAVAVGVQPLGALTTRGGSGVAPYIETQLEHTAIVGTTRETNLEAVIALQPDLILAAPTLSAEQYALLAAIAPTIVPAIERTSATSWKQESLIFARALNKEAVMQERLAQVEQRAAELKSRFDQLQPNSSRKTTLARWMPQGALVMSPDLFATGLLSAVGFAPQDGGLIKNGRPHSSPLSAEKLSVIDGDWLFLATLNKEGQDALDAARQSPAFSRLEVVKQERVVPVDGTLWTSASGPLAANAVLDQLDSLLTRLTP